MKINLLFVVLLSTFLASICYSADNETQYISSHDFNKSMYGDLEHYGIATTPAGNVDYCYQIFAEESKSYEDLENICRIYAETKEDEDLSCRSKRIKGTETKDSIRELKNICSSLAHKAAYKAVQSYKRKRSFKNFFK